MNRLPHLRSVVVAALTAHGASVAAQAIMQNEYTIPPSNISGWFRAVENTDEGFTLIARPLEADSADVFDIVLLRTDADGEVMWAREYNMPGSQAAVHITRTDNGANWVLAEDHSGTTRGMLLRTHPGDDLPLWAWAAVAPAGSSIRFLAHAPMGNDMIVLGMVTDSVSNAWEHIVFRTAPNGSVLWSRRLAGGSLSLQAIAVDPDDRIVLAGRGIGSGGEIGLAVLCLSAAGALEWTRLYGDHVSNRANSISIAPTGDLLITGSASYGAGAGGVVIRANAQGVATSMQCYQHEVINGYALTDGSAVLFVQHPGGVAHMQRVLPTGEVPWSAGLGTSLGLSQLLPYAEGSHYAFITGGMDLTNSITVTTFTAQCISCTGAPGVAVLPTDTTLAPGDLEVVTTPFSFGMEPLTMTWSDFGAVGATDCMLPIGMDGPKAPEMKCAYDPGARNAIIDTPSKARVELNVFDAMGRALPATAARTDGRIVVDLHDAARFAPGVYTIGVRANEGMKACRFVIWD